MKKGFSFVEMLVVLAISGILTAALYGTYVKLYSGAKQQSKLAESSIERYIGTEIMRRDLVNMGLGIAVGETITGSTDALYPVRWHNAQKAFSIYTTYDRLDHKTHGWRLLKCNDVQLCEFDNAVTGIDGEVYSGLKVISTLNGKEITPAFGNVNSPDYYYAIGYPYDTSKADKYRTVTYSIDSDCNGDGKSDVAARCAAGTSTLCRNNVPILDCVASWKLYGGYADSEGITYNTLENIGNLDNGTNFGNIRRFIAYLLVQEGQYDKDFRFGSDTVKQDLDFDAANDPLDEVQFTIPTGGQHYRWNIVTVDVRTYNVRR